MTPTYRGIPKWDPLVNYTVFRPIRYYLELFFLLLPLFLGGKLHAE